MSQTEVGKKMVPPITFQQVQKYEKGTNRISGSRIVQLCTLFGCTPDALLGVKADGKSDTAKSQNELLVFMRDKEMLEMMYEILTLPLPKRRVVTRAFCKLIATFR